MANNGLSVDTILDRFPIKDITKNTEEPTFSSDRDAQNQLKAKSPSISANINGGHFSLLGLIIQPKTYEMLMGRLFIKHTILGSL